MLFHDVLLTWRALPGHLSPENELFLLTPRRMGVCTRVSSSCWRTVTPWKGGLACDLVSLNFPHFQGWGRACHSCWTKQLPGTSAFLVLSHGR